jgi:putative PIG3 family NAD(P)H quinone oxidoreductase
MTVVEITQPGEPEVLRPARREVPTPGAGEVLIAVAGAGVNRPDVMQRRGKYPPPPGASDLPGLEVAGTIAAVGPEVARWQVGDTVCALVAGGGYAEYCLAPASQCLPVPDGLDVVSAAALPETCFTVWTNLFERGGLEAGDWTLVHGGSSGIGTTAIQLARAFGAHVIATAGSADKCAACERLGAFRAINYREEDFVAAVREITEGHGVDVLLDMIGAEYLARNLECLAMDGRLVIIGTLGGVKAAFNLVPLLQRRLTMTGSTLRARSVAQKAAIARALEAQVWPLIARGTVRPMIDRTFPLMDAAAAHRRMESSAHIGKLVLTTVELKSRTEEELKN